VKYDIWVHENGHKGVCVDSADGKVEAKKAAKAASSVWYPYADTVWNGETALLVKRGGEVISTIAIEAPEVREHRERKKA
jgi:hypothetical protein